MFDKFLNIKINFYWVINKEKKNIYEKIRGIFYDLV